MTISISMDYCNPVRIHGMIINNYDYDYDGQPLCTGLYMQAHVMSHFSIFYIIRTNYKHHMQTHNSVIKPCVGTNITIFTLAEIMY